MTTLEEVFFKISNDAYQEDKFVTRDSSMEVGLGGENTECNLIPDLTEIKINILESLWALCLLFIRRLIRSLHSLFFRILIPLGMVVVGLAFMKTQNINTRGLLHLDDPKGMYSGKDQLRLAFSKENNLPRLMDFMESKGFQVQEYSGMYLDLLNLQLSDHGTMAALASNASLTTLRINETFLHSPPLLLNMLSQYYLNSTGRNASLSANVKSFSSKMIAFDPSTLSAMNLIGPSLSLPAVAMVTQLVQDREIGARTHLRINGVSFSIYLSSIFIVFGFLTVVITLWQICLFYILGIATFMNPFAVTVTFTLQFLFIIPCLLFSTLFSFLLDHLQSAQLFSIISFSMGSLAGTFILVIDTFFGLSRPKSVLIAHGFFSALDVFYIPFGVFYWVNKQFLICSLTGKCDELTFSDYLGPEIVIMAICLIVQIPIFIVLIVIYDAVMQGNNPWSTIISIFKTRDMNSNGIHNLSGDDNNVVGEFVDSVELDVLDNRGRVTNILNGREQVNDPIILAHNLIKTYQAKTSIKDRCRKAPREGNTALKGINFSVEKGEVFGLLGHNGAGKSTTMRIITAEESHDSGIVRVCGHDIDSNYSNSFLKLGYCPQHDPLWKNISLREHLELYVVVRGIPRNVRNKIINQLLIGLHIEEHASKKAAQLSSGTKRMLIYGISILGASGIVLLDEPSTGMDPHSKRILWNTISGSFKEYRGAILTTRSMEEAEKLCSRIAILEKGSLVFIGSPQHLKSKYGSAYTLEIKLKCTNDVMNDDQDRYRFVKEHFPDCKVNQLFHDRAIFALSTASVPSISKMFAWLEQMKRQYNIKEYSFGKTTLDQFFLNFGKDEETDEN